MRRASQSTGRVMKVLTGALIGAVISAEDWQSLVRHDAFPQRTSFQNLYVAAGRYRLRCLQCQNQFPHLQLWLAYHRADQLMRQSGGAASVQHLLAGDRPL